MILRVLVLFFLLENDVTWQKKKLGAFSLFKENVLNTYQIAKQIVILIE